VEISDISAAQEWPIGTLTPFCFQSVVSAGRHGYMEKYEDWRMCVRGLGVVCTSCSTIVKENARISQSLDHILVTQLKHPTSL
jgi:hypothetical protein